MVSLTVAHFNANKYCQKEDFYKIKGRVQCFIQVFGYEYLSKVETGKNLATVFLFNQKSILYRKFSFNQKSILQAGKH